jgi:hypothetical protein
MITTTTVPMHSRRRIKSPNSKFIQFRIDDQMLFEMSRIAQMLFDRKMLKSPSISELARSCTITRINEIIKIEAQQRAAAEEAERQLRKYNKSHNAWLQMQSQQTQQVQQDHQPAYTYNPNAFAPLTPPPSPIPKPVPPLKELPM